MKKDIVTLTNALFDAFDWVKTDPRRAPQVKEMANTAGKIINACRTRIEYAVARKEKPEIEFLDK